MPENGYGTSPFGTSPFGFWQPARRTPSNRTVVNARQLDPITRAPVIVDGKFVEDSPVRQRVLLAMQTTKGSIPGLESWGNNLKAVTHVDENFASNVQAYIREALKPIQEIEILEITAEPQNITLTYRIKRTGENETIQI